MHMRCVDVAPQLSQCVDGGDDMFDMVAATPSNNVDNTILTYKRHWDYRQGEVLILTSRIGDPTSIFQSKQ